MRKSLAAATSAGLMMAGGLAAATADTVDTAPLRSIALAGAGDPMGVAQDAEGFLYVTRNNRTVEVFAPGADGDDAPVRILAGIETGLTSPRQPAVDDTGRLAVPNASGNYVHIFAAGAGGNVAPVQAVNAGLDFPIGVAFDSADRVYVTSYDADSVSVFGAGAGSGTPAVRTIVGPATGLDGPKGIAVGPNGEIYVANGLGRTITEFAPGADGNIAPVRTLTNVNGLPQPESVAVDGSGNIYVTNFEGGVAMFAPGARNADPPLHQLVGESTGLSTSWGVAVDADRNVTVANAGPHTVSTFAPLAPLTVPGKVRSLEVKGSPTDRQRPVDWVPPVDDGGAPITAYKYVVSKNGHAVSRGSTDGSKVTLRRADLPRGLLTVTVRARNSEGTGLPASRSFHVRK